MRRWAIVLRERIERRPAAELGARYSLIMPFAAIAVGFVLIKTSDLVFHIPDGIVNLDALAGALLLLVTSSGIAGVVSLFAVSRSTRKPVLWRAVIGIIASGVVGLLSFVLLALPRHPF